MGSSKRIIGKTTKKKSCNVMQFSTALIFSATCYSFVFSLYKDMQVWVAYLEINFRRQVFSLSSTLT